MTGHNGLNYDALPSRVNMPRGVYQMNQVVGCLFAKPATGYHPAVYDINSTQLCPPNRTNISVIEYETRLNQSITLCSR